MNPNGLTEEQIAARPALPVGHLFYSPTGDWWAEDGIGAYFDTEFHLLPGEPGCPWPPPDEFRHEWKEGDRAWILYADADWDLVTVASVQPGYVSMESSRECYDWVTNCPPAIYIPEEQRDSCYRVADGRLINARTRKAVE